MQYSPQSLRTCAFFRLSSIENPARLKIAALYAQQVESPSLRGDAGDEGPDVVGATKTAETGTTEGETKNRDTAEPKSPGVGEEATRATPDDELAQPKQRSMSGTRGRATPVKAVEPQSWQYSQNTRVAVDPATTNRPFTRAERRRLETHSATRSLDQRAETALEEATQSSKTVRREPTTEQLASDEKMLTTRTENSEAKETPGTLDGSEAKGDRYVRRPTAPRSREMRQETTVQYRNNRRVDDEQMEHSVMKQFAVKMNVTSMYELTVDDSAMDSALQCRAYNTENVKW
ncbi:hypothetical protein PPTG_01874 [Phytophthora nicotianae INRA-310]|uniref:Uncharacterized protein n=1 Tax=Phytophthora nicotianae (strain INRA-310) TaxID=761204 RepID=W2RAT0_PHYN3|nr:hypothetical protein PPTG_01874 [Phytophthora nicotianae INRA-310]ETN21779.1 hypothetical protein PPTG_01874 [Phytophthora nicotianae INRA-310]